MRPSIVAVLLLAAGCAAPGAPPPAKKDRREIVEWRLVERLYASIEDGWATAGDGDFASGELALVYEPVYRDERPLVQGLVTGRTACDHRPCVEYRGDWDLKVGDPIPLTLWVEGPPDVAHVVDLAGSHSGIAILRVAGAEALAGERGRYVLEAGARAEVVFTSTSEGPGGLRISVVRERAKGDGPGGPADAVRARK